MRGLKYSDLKFGITDKWSLIREVVPNVLREVTTQGG